MKIIIDKLYKYAQFQPIVFDWIYNEWGNNNPLYWSSWINSSTRYDDEIPITFIVLDDSIPIGTFSLWRCDLQSRQDLFPWFGGLYLISNYRGKYYNGIKLSYYIQNFALYYLKNIGFLEVYLFSEKGDTYYINNGWISLCRGVNELDQHVFICKYDLTLI